MIIDNTYFKGEIYIPHAKPSITDAVTEVEGDIIDFIDEYARECLLKCLGYKLFNEFSNILDSAADNGIQIGADQKWDDLLNGTTYLDPVTGDTVVWRGIRFKSTPAGEYDRSFLANYVYFYYERHDNITRSDIGNVKENGKNSFTETAASKVSRAWNKFVDMVQGKKKQPIAMIKHGFLGVDWMSQHVNQDVTLYKFITDSNILDETKYVGFNPYMWDRINEFGL